MTRHTHTSAARNFLKAIKPRTRRVTQPRARVCFFDDKKINTRVYVNELAYNTFFIFYFEWHPCRIISRCAWRWMIHPVQTERERESCRFLSFSLSLVGFGGLPLSLDCTLVIPVYVILGWKLLGLFCRILRMRLRVNIVERWQKINME